MDTCKYVNMHIYIYMQNVYIYIYIYIYVCTYVYMCMYAYICITSLTVTASSLTRPDAFMKEGTKDGRNKGRTT